MAETTANERQRTRESHEAQMLRVDETAWERVHTAQAALENTRTQLNQLELKMQALARDNGSLQRQLGEAEGQGRAAERERDALTVQVSHLQQHLDAQRARSGQDTPAPPAGPCLPEGTMMACPACVEAIDLSGRTPGGSVICPGCDADLVIDTTAGTLRLAGPDL